MTPESLWTIEDVATYLGLPVQTIYQWRTKRQGPRAFKIGRHLRYRQADVDTWLEGQADDWHADAFRRMEVRARRGS